MYPSTHDAKEISRNGNKANCIAGQIREKCFVGGGRCLSLFATFRPLNSSVSRNVTHFGDGEKDYLPSIPRFKINGLISFRLVANKFHESTSVHAANIKSGFSITDLVIINGRLFPSTKEDKITNIVLHYCVEA